MTVCCDLWHEACSRLSRSSHMSSENTQRCILVVDDQPGTRRLVRNLLESTGHRVVEAGDEQSAWHALRTLRSEVGLAIIDVDLMGDIRGPYLALGFKSYLDLPIILMSGHPRESLIATHHLQASVPFVQKPFTLREMMETVATVCGEGNSSSLGPVPVRH